MSYTLVWILKCLKLYPSISLINDSAATTQSFSHSAILPQSLAEWLEQPLSHCQSGWVAYVKISAIARSILKTPTTNKLRRCRKTSSPKKTWWFSKGPIIKIDNHRHEKNQLIKRWFQSHSAQVLFVGKVRLDQFGWRSCPTHPEPTPL